MITGVLLRVATKAGDGVFGGDPERLRPVAARSDDHGGAAGATDQLPVPHRVERGPHPARDGGWWSWRRRGVSILLSLYNSMDQRRRRSRCCGCWGVRAGIFGLVLTGSALIGGIGAAVGLVLSYVGSLAASRAMFESLGLLIEPVYGLEWVLAVIVGAVLLSAAGLGAGGASYRTSVAENLKPAV